ncbi:MAG: hypothetical protein FWC55_07415 [Firmicutes bacterium]|nr:hypothetical protein [Bacillota bacterium]
MIKPLVIGIAGGSGCGKSDFCEVLAKSLPEYRVCQIHMDRYYRDPLPQMISPLTGRQGDDFNHPDSVDYEKPLDLIRTIRSDGIWNTQNSGSRSTRCRRRYTPT